METRKRQIKKPAKKETEKLIKLRKNNPKKVEGDNAKKIIKSIQKQSKEQVWEEIWNQYQKNIDQIEMEYRKDRKAIELARIQSENRLNERIKQAKLLLQNQYREKAYEINIINKK